jgi:hypothetical protein
MPRCAEKFQSGSIYDSAVSKDARRAFFGLSMPTVAKGCGLQKVAFKKTALITR